MAIALKQITHPSANRLCQQDGCWPWWVRTNMLRKLSHSKQICFVCQPLCWEVRKQWTKAPCPRRLCVRCVGVRRASVGMSVTDTHISEADKSLSNGAAAAPPPFLLPPCGFRAGKSREIGYLSGWEAGSWGPLPAWPYLVQGCESILVAQIRADFILQEVAHCNREDRSEHPAALHAACGVCRGAQVRPTLPGPDPKGLVCLHCFGAL